jgi:hypothetical protein
MPTNASQRETTVRIITLEFRTTNLQKFFSEAGQLLRLLDEIIANLQWMAWRKEDQYGYSFANVEVLELTENSPLN